MTTLIVKPIRADQPGSYKERKRLRRLAAKMTAAQATQDMGVVAQLWEEADDLLIARLTTDDGTPVEDVLDTLSADDFDKLFQALTAESPVGEANTVPSGAGPEDTAATSPIG